ncbi:hypothetical protein [Saccharopolyspora elongata]|uniref:Uncharacterized protein n=1 Tax=Saccharopolyspora elongata TaxID=2530387 RepID=A0A4R4YAY6_9PSEU|nr:hypothetical protein [Saccharopolyspora elongata]TDD40282.1 hypothetical protein E1288_35725 [Saccharopolyspora elongata]
MKGEPYTWNSGNCSSASVLQKAGDGMRSQSYFPTGACSHSEIATSPTVKPAQFGAAPKKPTSPKLRAARFDPLIVAERLHERHQLICYEDRKKAEMSDVSQAAAQLEALADSLPYGAAQVVANALDEIATQASSLVAETGHADVVGVINNTGNQIAEHITTQLGALAAQLRDKATAIRT